MLEFEAKSAIIKHATISEDHSIDSGLRNELEIDWGHRGNRIPFHLSFISFRTHAVT